MSPKASETELADEAELVVQPRSGIQPGGGFYATPHSRYIASNHIAAYILQVSCRWLAPARSVSQSRAQDFAQMGELERYRRESAGV
jgi:hypothetical protein